MPTSPNMTAILLCRSGDDAGLAQPLHGRCLIGRSADCDLAILHPSLSREHAQIDTDGEGRVILTDLGSMNGTVLKGERLVKGDPAVAGDWTMELGDADVVVHLAGASVSGGRWSAARKRELIGSRIDSTRVLVDAFEASGQPPKAFVCASAVGYYGPAGEEPLAETSGAGTDFLARLCVDWEAEAARAEAIGIRTVSLRFGVVMSGAGGALRMMLPIFKLGLGGPLGPPDRWFPYVGARDAVGLCRFAMERDVRGPINVVAPEPVRMREFARTLGRVLRRPAIAPVPLWALRLALGELGDSMVPGQKVEPAAAHAAGYAFLEPTLEAVLRGVCAP
jgi:uncharacterized protein (TIGR01777 family)